MKNTVKGLCICALLASGMALQAQDAGQSAYVKFDGGLSLVNDLEQRNGPGKIEVDPGFRLDAAVGYQFTSEISAEIEGGFLLNSIKDADVDLYQVPILANVIYKLPLEGKIKPYVGAGAGGIFGIVDGDDVSENDFTFAFQGIAGVDYELSANASIGIAYKFLGALEPEFDDVELENVYTHSILAAFTYKF